MSPLNVEFCPLLPAAPPFPKGMTSYSERPAVSSSRATVSPRLRVALIPRILLARIEIEGNETLSDQQVLDVLGVREGGEVTPASIVSPVR